MREVLGNVTSTQGAVTQYFVLVDTTDLPRRAVVHLASRHARTVQVESDEPGVLGFEMQRAFQKSFRILRSTELIDKSKEEIEEFVTQVRKAAGIKNESHIIYRAFRNAKH